MSCRLILFPRSGRNVIPFRRPAKLPEYVAYVTNLCSDRPNWPGHDLMLRIGELTNGSVTANDFLSRIPAKQPERAAQ